LKPDQQTLTTDRITVLGGLGFMGSHICRELVRRGRTVRIFDKLHTSRELVADIEREIEIVEGDILRPHDVMSALTDTQTIIHLVHTTRPGSSMQDPSFDISTNVVASAKWLAALSQTKVRRIIFVSSGGTVYGIPRRIPIDENHPTDPICSYGITKLAIEKYLAMYAEQSNIEYCCLRPSNVYGEGQPLNVGQGVIGVLADRALRGLPLEIWGTGQSLRDYLYVADMVAAMMAVLEYRGAQRVFNVSSGQGHSVVDVVQALSRTLEFAPELSYMPDRGFDVPANVLDSTRLQAETGWQPTTSLEQGIARTIAWLRSQVRHEPVHQ
jgi:UDP-glucose 4-epimerase